MARRRRPPSTPFGAWLNSWLELHSEITLEALGQEVGVTNSAISLWLSGETKKIGIEYLRKLSITTGEPLDNLERLVYGEGTRRALETPLPYLTDSEIDAIAERAALRVVAILRAEGWAPIQAAGASAARRRPSKP